MGVNRAFADGARLQLEEISSES